MGLGLPGRPRPGGSPLTLPRRLLPRPPRRRARHHPRLRRGRGSEEAFGLSPVALDLPALLERVFYRYPSFLLDAVKEHEPGVRLVAIKNVTVGEEYFQGHFPGSPLMPGVLLIEALTQVAAVLILDREPAPGTARAFLRGVNSAKFRKGVVPGDRLCLEVTLGRCRSRLAKAQAVAYVDGEVVTEADRKSVV